jgi:hypothetical protein
MIKGALGNTNLFDDIVDRGLLVALFKKELLGGIQELFEAFVIFFAYSYHN